MMTEDEIACRHLEIEIWFHYNSYVCKIYRLSQNDREAFVMHMNLMIPPERITPPMDWRQYHIDMLTKPMDIALKREALTYATQDRNLSYLQIQRMFKISPNKIRELRQANLALFPPNPEYRHQLLQIEPYWNLIKDYRIAMW